MRMNTLAIDTHKTIQNLMKKGYTEEQAEGFVEALTGSELLTKSYHDASQAELKASIIQWVAVLLM